MTTQLPDTACCLGCDYSLRGLPGVICPECGRAFDPDDPTTYRDKAVVSKWRLWATPPGIWHTAGVLAMTWIVLEGRSRPMGTLEWLPFYLPCCVALIGGPLLLAIYAVRAIAACSDRLRAEHDRAEQARSRTWSWLVTPVCLSLALSAFVVNWPLHARFAASQAALETEARRLLANTPATANPYQGITCERFIGLYHVDFVRVDQKQRSIYFFTHPGLIDPIGFVYSPQGAVGLDVGLPKNWFVYED